MKQKQRILRSILYVPILLGIMFLCACSGGDDGDDPVVSSDILNVDPGALTLNGNSGSGNLNIQANCHWKIEKRLNGGEDWLSVEPEDGTNNQIVTVKAISDNPSATSTRQMTLTIKSDGGISRNIIVTQNPSQEILTVSPLTLSFDYSGGTKEFTISTNASWTISGANYNWFTLSRKEGQGAQTIQVNVYENTSETETRTATLTILTNSGKTANLTIVQEYNSSITLDVTPLSVTASAPKASYEVQITGNAAWTATSNQSWANIDKSSGSGAATLNIHCDDNTTLTERTAIVTVRYFRSDFNIVVTQAAGSLPVVSAVEVSDASKESVTLSSSFTSVFPVTEYGICYGTTANPTINDTKESAHDAGKTQGEFTYQLKNLNATDIYYARAYAISVVGVAYSDNTVFTTTGRLPDIDDNERPNAAKKR